MLSIVTVPSQMSSSDSEIPSHDDDEDEITRNSMLFSLLDLLHSAATSGIIPGPAYLSSDISQKPKRIGISKPQQRPSSGHTVTVPPHYYLGDLGIIPKPARSLGQVRGVRSRNVGVQTAVMGKVRYGSDWLMKNRRFDMAGCCGV